MGLPKECELQLENRYARGEKNLITDVPGVRVGHVTLNDDDKDVQMCIRDRCRLQEDRL